jgi:putative membrane protein
VSAPDSKITAVDSSRSGRVWLLILGLGLLIAVLVANDLRAVVRALLEVRAAAIPVVASHLLVTFAAALGWIVLLDAAERPNLRAAFRLRLIKEAVNALLPVAQVGGDVVRARLAVTPRLPLRTAAASCLVDVGLSLICLTVFVLGGLGLASATVADARIDRLALQVAAAGGVLVVGLVAAERLGLLGLLDRATAKSQSALGGLAGLGDEVRRLSLRRVRLWESMFWHLASWSLGVLETAAALWAVGLDVSWERAFVLESLAQGARAVGFAIPGALGVQEGGYVLICSALGIPPDRALALSLLRRIRELSLGVVGLALWRFEAPRLPVENDPQ